MSVGPKIVQWVCGVLTGHAGTVERDPAGNINHLCSTCGKWAMRVVEVPLKPAQILEKPFDWMKEYGRLWEPGDAAFWLEPDTHQELADWMATYRPDVTGIVETAGMRIEIVPVRVRRGYYNGIRNFRTRR